MYNQVQHKYSVSFPFQQWQTSKMVVSLCLSRLWKNICRACSYRNGWIKTRWSIGMCLRKEAKPSNKELDQAEACSVYGFNGWQKRKGISTELWPLHLLCFADTVLLLSLHLVTKHPYIWENMKVRLSLSKEYCVFCSAVSTPSAEFMWFLNQWQIRNSDNGLVFVLNNENICPTMKFCRKFTGWNMIRCNLLFNWTLNFFTESKSSTSDHSSESNVWLRLATAALWLKLERVWFV